MDSVWVTVVSNAIVLIGIGFISYFQRNQITALKSTIDSQKSILDSLKVFSEIVRVDEFRKYVELTQENSRLEAEKRIREVTESYKANLQQTVNLSQQFVRKRIVAHMSLIVQCLVRIPPKDRVPLIQYSIEDKEIQKEVIDATAGTENIFYYKRAAGIYSNVIQVTVPSSPSPNDEKKT